MILTLCSTKEDGGNSKACLTAVSSRWCFRTKGFLLAKGLKEIVFSFSHNPAGGRSFTGFSSQHLCLWISLLLLSYLVNFPGVFIALLWSLGIGWVGKYPVIELL